MSVYISYIIKKKMKKKMVIGFGPFSELFILNIINRWVF